MERFSFGDDVAFVPRGDLLDGVTVAPLTQPFEEGALVQAAIFRFEPGGRLRRHPATTPRSSPSWKGQEKYAGADGDDEPIEAGEAVYLHGGEHHELKSAAGLTVLIIEGESLDRFKAH